MRKEIDILIIVVIGIFFCGCINQSQSIIPSKDQSLFICKEEQDCNIQKVSIISKDNFTDAQKKLSTDILQLTDSRYLPVGMTLDALKLQMEKNHQLTYATETGNTLVYVYIKMSENADTASINSFVYNVTNSDPANHLVVAWVDSNQIINLASLNSVRSIQSVTPPVAWRN